jgi:bifunctional ADP-heptose synthase (sugar kinase/adenylyltransferase)
MREKPYLYLDDIVGLWQDKRILVAGDPGYDVYHWGTCDRISPEAPVPVFVEQRIEDRPGMAYNVCQNLAALGCKPVQCFPPQPWTVKRRFMVGTHQLLRVDNDRYHRPPDNQWPDLDGIDAIVLSDYAKGFLTEDFCQGLIRRASSVEIPVIVDPKNVDWWRFNGAAVICPNHLEMGNRPPGMILPYIVEKRGSNGIRLHDSLGFTDFPAQARHVYDVTGAGDTVVAVVAASLACGALIRDACRLANLAAGHVVGEVGTATCSAAQLSALLEAGAGRQ